MHVKERSNKLHCMTWPCVIGYYYMGNAIWSRLYAVSIGSKKPAKSLAQPCTHSGHDHTTLLVVWTVLWWPLVCAYWVTDVVLEVLSRMHKPYWEGVRTPIDHMEVSYDGMIIIYHVSIYLYCIEYFSLISTVLHNETFNVKNNNNKIK
jgi:hypothetical protein